MRICRLGAAVLLAFLAVDAKATRADEVEWSPDWPKFRWTEGVATGGLIAASYFEDCCLTGPSSPHWTGAILFDNQARGLFRGRSLHVQQTATKYADLGYTTLTFFPYFDVAIALGVHREPGVALQMGLIDAQALSFTSAFTNLTKWVVARQRPYVRDCGADGRSGGIHSCGSTNDNIGFFSGHTSATFTGAALTCVHHQHLPLYGGPAADTWACIWALTGATTVAVLRMVSDDHYASDVMMGAAAGILSGYVLPSLLHYGFGFGHAAKNHADVPQTLPLIMPMGTDGVGVGLTGPL